MEPRKRARILLETPQFGLAKSMPRPDDPKDAQTDAFNRRSFIHGAAASAVALPLAAGTAAQLRDDVGAAPRADGIKSENVTLHVNQQLHTLSLDPRTTLLDALRDHAGLTGTKRGCGDRQ